MTRTVESARLESDHLTRVVDGIVRLSNALHAAGRHADEAPEHVRALLEALGSDRERIATEAQRYAASIAALQDSLTHVAAVALAILREVEQRAVALEAEAPDGRADG